MPAYAPFSPVDIRVLPKAQGEAALRQLLSGQTHRLLVLCPRLLIRELSLTAMLSALQGDRHSVHLATDIPANPSVHDLVALLNQLRQQEFVPTAILAIGGGSCIDLAKGFSAFCHMPLQTSVTADALRKSILDKTYISHPHPFVDLIAMPTTAGTGSEVTKWATIWDIEHGQKLSIDCPQCFARAAILIPDWTAGMPMALTLSTGLDALSHAMEAFWAKARTPLSQALALSAVEKARHFLPLALSQPQNLTFRQEMCMASLLAGLAFSGTRTTACHSISYPLTMLHGIPHGFAVALTLSAVLRRNFPAVPEIAQLQALFKPEGGLDAWLSQVCEGIQPLLLSAFGIGEENLSDITRLTFTAGRMDNNPVRFTQDEVLAILRECL